MKNVTLATVKSFVRTSVKDLYVKTLSQFDGMVDGVRNTDNPTYRKVESVNMDDVYRLGISGAWFVRDSRDYFNKIDTPEWTGYEVNNCCGSCELVVPANSQSASRLRARWEN